MNDRPRLPRWLKRPLPCGKAVTETRAILRDLQLHTVCEEAECPNLGECFGRRVATFLILGDICTRRCKFCAIAKGKPAPPDENEPAHLAEAAERLQLRHVVITSVNRDDLDDDGAGQYCNVICAIRERMPSCAIEILSPDFRGREACFEQFAGHEPDIWGHNIECVPRMYKEFRSGATYPRALQVLRHIHERFPHVPTKSGLQLGLGEKQHEVIDVLKDLRAAGVSMVTLGQYLRPSDAHYPVVEYIHPEVFAHLGQVAYDLGFDSVLSEPFARSSYLADGKETTTPGAFQRVGRAGTS